MFIVFNIILLCCTVLATESTKCDCDIFQIFYSDDENIYRNFTKQTAEIKGQPIYYSYVKDVSQYWNMIWWNEEKSQWMGHSGKLEDYNEIEMAFTLLFFCNCYLIKVCFF